MRRTPNMAKEKTPIPTRAAEVRREDFLEAEQGYTPEQAMAEASRCLNCPAKYCQNSCPVRVPVPEFIHRVREGDFQAAYGLIKEVNATPEISGRVCPQERQCERGCTRAIKGEAVAIGRLERFVADFANNSKASAPEPTGKRVAVVGAGPAGIACSRELALAGCAVTVFEARDFLGGVPAWGIPDFVLPAEITARQSEELSELGVVIRTGKVLGEDFTLAKLKANGFDAVFVATGAEKPVVLEAETISGANVSQAKDFLASVKSGSKPELAGTVAVVGGGDTAVDAARTALRCGAKRVLLLYRRTEKEIPARSHELQMALDEGVELITLTSPVRFRQGAVDCVRMELTAPDYPGGRKNTAVLPDSGHSYEISSVILAAGFENYPVDSLKTDDLGRVITDDDGATSEPGVFSGGDAVTGPSSVIRAAASGKAAAIGILKYLS